MAAAGSIMCTTLYDGSRTKRPVACVLAEVFHAFCMCRAFARRVDGKPGPSLLGDVADVGWVAAKDVASAWASLEGASAVASARTPFE